MFQRADIQNAFNFPDFCRHGLRAVLEQVFARGVERAFVKPAKRGFRMFLRGEREIFIDKKIAARNIDVAVQPDGCRLAGKSLRHFPFRRDDFGHFGGQPVRFDADGLPDGDRTAFDAPLIASETVGLVGILADDQLDGEIKTGIAPPS